MRVRKQPYTQLRMEIFDDAAEAFKPQPKRNQTNRKEYVGQDDLVVGRKVAKRELGDDIASRMSDEDLTRFGSFWAANGAIPNVGYRDAIAEMREKYGPPHVESPEINDGSDQGSGGSES